MPKYNRLTEFERERISKMLASGHSYTLIASTLGRSVSTIGREVFRNFTIACGEYLAVEAHKKASKRQLYSHAPKSKINQVN